MFGLFAGVASTIARRSGSIALFVSHRFSTDRLADHIVVLRDGRAAEQGDHDTLVAGGGLYHELHAIQARAYDRASHRRCRAAQTQPAAGVGDPGDRNSLRRSRLAYLVYSSS